MGLEKYLFFIALLLMKQSHQDSCMLTKMCPATKELWNQRSKTFNCTERGTNYTCILNKENRLIETCMYENVVGKEIVGCPSITTCKDSPQIAPENHYTDCPENIPGCPKWNHEPYTIFEMYKYPACFYSDKYEYAFLNILPTTTDILDKTQRPTTDQSSATPVGLIIGITIAITMLLTLILVIVVLVLIKRCLRRKRERSYINTEDDMTEFKGVTPKNSEKKQSTYSQLLLQSSDESFSERLKRTLLQISKKAVASISFSPVQKIHKLPLELLFAKVIISTNDKVGSIDENVLYTMIRQDNEVKGPNDLFYKDEEATRRIYMKGEAARGKTTYCLWLLQHWIHAQQRRSTKQLNEWENALGGFEFVFFIPLRDVNKSRATVIDMICHDVLDIENKEYIEWVKNVLKSDKYHCLIIIDGLDEWGPDQNVTNHPNFKEMPILDDIKNCVIFITMRPWKFEFAKKNVTAEDRVVKILGLDKAGIKSMTANVLKNHYGLDITRSTGKLRYDEMIHKIENDTLRPLMEIPLLAVVCVEIWFKKEKVGECLTKFYIEMVHMLIERTEEKHDIDEVLETSHNDATKSAGLCGDFIFSKYMTVLSRLGKLAFDGLLARKYTFEFYADRILEELGMTDSELKFSLNVGLLSKEDVDSTLTRKVKIYFFHKLVQEFLGAVYIVGTEEGRYLLSKHMCNIKVIIELGNVLKFLSGLDPKLGSSISQSIVNLINGDVEFCERRRNQTMFLDIGLPLEIYEIQIGCFKEFKRNTDETPQTLLYHVSDVYLTFTSDTDTVKVTCDILDHHNADIKLLHLAGVPTDSGNGISDTVVTQFLDQTKALQSLYVNGFRTNRAFDKISDRFSSLTSLIFSNITLTPRAVRTLESALQHNRVIETLGLEFITCQTSDGQCNETASLCGLLQVLPELQRLSSLRIQISNSYEKPVFLEMLCRLSHLNSIEYYQTSPEDDDYDYKVLQHLCTWKGLQGLWLGYINLTDKGLVLSPDTNILTLLLNGVTMSKRDWHIFIQAINKIEHTIEISLNNVDIDEESLSMLRSSAHRMVHLLPYYLLA